MKVRMNSLELNPRLNPEPNPQPNPQPISTGLSGSAATGAADAGVADTAVATHSIGAVERDTGLTKDTLRVWERRYQFPQPQRDANGERVYPIAQVNKLRLLKRLIDCGHRPGKIVRLEVEQLHRLNEALMSAQPRSVAVTGRDELQAYIDSCKARQGDDLRRALSQALLRMGLQAFVVDLVAPLTRRVGEDWAQGLLAVYEEHLYTEVTQNVLRNAISAILQRPPHAEQRPRVMLTTFPQEAHGLGLLMAEAIFELEGAQCISLGVQTPVIDIVRAAQAQQADIVALSFSGVMNPHQIQDGLHDLIIGLPETVEVWVGGSNPALARRRQKVHMLNLPDIASALRAWRGRHPGIGVS